jgi:carboxymethylenebutenolidase
MPNGTSEAVFFAPDAQSPRPGVIHSTGIGGIRPAHRQMARQLAAEGFAVPMPNLFYRTARPPVFGIPRDAPRDVLMKRVGELAAPLTPAAIEADAARDFDSLLGRDAARKDLPIGGVGYCISGALALRFAAARPQAVGAAASFHGRRLFPEAPDSVHLVLPQVRARLYFAHAVKDPSMPREAIEGLERALKGRDGEYESETYEGAYHSWTSPDSPVYNASQAARAFEKLVELFKRGSAS